MTGIRGRVAVAQRDGLAGADGPVDASVRRLPGHRQRDVLARRALARAVVARVAPGATAVHRPGRPPVVEGPGPLFVSVTAGAGLVAAAVADTPVGIDLVCLEARSLQTLRRPTESLRAAAERWALHEAVLKYEAVGGDGAELWHEVVDVGEHHLLAIACSGGPVDVVGAPMASTSRLPAP